MKIGVVGCGAVGSYYGARLCRAGQEVHFLLRSDHAAVARDGVRIRSVEGDFVAWPRCAREPGEIGVCDLVVVGLKTTANGEFRRLLPPLVGPRTTVLTLQNGLGNEEALAALFGPAPVLGGLCFVCLNRVAPGEVVHTAHGAVVLGEYQRPPGERVDAVHAALAAAGVSVRVAADLDRAHWEKLVWNIPFNGLGVAGAAGHAALESGHVDPAAGLGPCLATDALLADPGWEGQVRGLMTEVIAGARALGHPLASELAERNLERTRVMGSYKASTLVDFERGQALEIESLFGEPRRRAGAAGVILPRLGRLCAVLEQLDGRARGCAPGGAGR